MHKMAMKGITNIVVIMWRKYFGMPGDICDAVKLVIIGVILAQ